MSICAFYESMSLQSTGSCPAPRKDTGSERPEVRGPERARSWKDGHTRCPSQPIFILWALFVAVWRRQDVLTKSAKPDMTSFYSFGPDWNPD
jgi:hypothetical protein